MSPVNLVGAVDEIGDMPYYAEHCAAMLAVTYSSGQGMQRNIVSEGTTGEQGWRSGQTAHLPPMCPGFDSQTLRHMWVEFVGSLLCSERFFSEYSGLPLSSKISI